MAVIPAPYRHSRPFTVIPAKAGISYPSHRHRLETDEEPVEWDVRRVLGRGRLARAFWIPAYAGMTVYVGAVAVAVIVVRVGRRGVANTLSRRFAASSPLIGRGGSGARVRVIVASIASPPPRNG